MWIGYNTNGFAHHRLEDALTVLNGLGYQGVALTLDVHSLDPFDPEVESEAEDIRRDLDKLRLKCVIETGARFLIDPQRKHQPTLLDPLDDQRALRVDFLERSIQLASYLGSDLVSLWSGTPLDDAGHDVWMTRLVEALEPLADLAESKGVRLAFEPEPGMFIETLDQFHELHERMNHPAFGLTLDIGHMQCLGELPLADRIMAQKDRLWNVHLDDMRQGIHDHLMFGAGEINFAEVFSALKACRYNGPATVELSRHSSDAVETARKSLAFIRSVSR